MRIVILSLCCLLFISAYASPINNKTKPPEDFDNYVEGAMVVYSQFKKPSKKESEEFYSFIKSKWTYVSCTNNCASIGYKAGSEYAKKKNIEIKEEK